MSIIYDYNCIRDYDSVFLPKLSHEVVAFCQDGDELVTQCRLLRPDLVITDFRMNRLDGIEAARKIHEEFPVAMILVSAYHDQETIARGGPYNVLAYLVKPI